MGQFFFRNYFITKINTLNFLFKNVKHVLKCHKPREMPKLSLLLENYTQNSFVGWKVLCQVSVPKKKASKRSEILIVSFKFFHKFIIVHDKWQIG